MSSLEEDIREKLMHLLKEEEEKTDFTTKKPLKFEA